LFAEALAHHQSGLVAQAERLYRQVLAIDAGHAGSHHLLGIIAYETGRYDTAVEEIGKAIAITPGLAASHTDLGNALKMQGRLDEAAASHRSALELKPDYPEAHNNLGIVLKDQGRLDEAAACYRRAIELKPEYPEAYNNLGIVLEEQGKLDEAVVCYHRALGLRQNFAEVHNNLGNALRVEGRLEEAVESYRRALALKPGYADAFNNLGNAFKDMGKLDEAMDAYTQAVAIDPRAASAWYNRTEHKRFTAGDPDIGRMEALLEPGGLAPLSARMLIHFGLGKAYFDIKDSDRAFRHLKEANRLKRSTFFYEASSVEMLTKNIIRTFTPHLFEQFEGAGNASDLPVFVVGFPRSGTTLVEQILASHPLVHGAGELTALQRIVAAMGVFPDFMGKLAPADVAHIAGVYLAHVAPLAAGRRYVVDKLPANFQFAGLIRLLFPNARIIHCRRDPVDACLSCYTKLFNDRQLFAYDMTELGRFHQDYQCLMTHWRSVLPQSSFLEVDYESVVEDVEGAARRMTSFLSLPWDDSCLRFHANPRPVLTASSCQVRQPIYKTSIGRWKAHAGHLKPLLDALGARA
jgi:tetratricopeptide (TPR) repeat protein